ncbi:NAD(P)-binding domain-containing protein [Robertkochia flava]|uniref:NAD(P)-binding domain-containing protein n=1 Tax=Robertkochia flava TaxID=3447986 RepID=UPI001CCE6B09|nr:NAD(P)H-binding protein [Robertkochia marina]
MTQKHLQLSILGCGWLGQALARELTEEGIGVKGSTTSPSKITALKEQGIDPFLIELQENTFKGPLEDFLKGSDILIIDIPPGLRKDPSRDFCAVLQPVVTALNGFGVKHTLIVSSTSVFPDEDDVFDEHSIFLPDSPPGKQMLQAEQLILDQNPGANTVLRLGGLIGPDRHPVHYLSGKSNLKGGSDRINLIHRDDVIGILKAIIAKEQWGKTLHGVAPHHPEKQEYYPEMADRFNIDPPYFKRPSSRYTGKVIDAAYTTELLSYNYQFPDLKV